MKRIIYLTIFAAVFFHTNSTAQTITGYTVTGSSVVSVDSCAKTNIQVSVSGVGLGFGLHVKTTFLGTTYISPVIPTMGGNVANFTFNINTPGNYTFKMLLADTMTVSGTAIDSTIISVTKFHCGFSTSGVYNDVNANCIFDAADYAITEPAIIEISLGATPIDTISCYGNINFMNNSTTGTIYKYRLLQPPPSFALSCPVSGIIYDTVGIYNVPKRFGFTCISSTNFDLQGNVNVRCGVHAAQANIIVKTTTATRLMPT